MSGSNVNAVFYAESYHPIQAGSIDGTDILSHDNAVYRALLCSSAGLYDPSGDPKVIGDPYCTVFVGRLSRLTSEETLRKAMSRYGRVKNLRLIRDIVTGASRGYAFVEYETERDMRRAYEEAHHSFIDDSEIIVDYNRQQLMPGWIPRRLGGGLGGKKESGQLRFGGRERPFRAPLRPIPWDDLKRLGIPPPPEGRYMTRLQVPSPPRRRSRHADGEDSPRRHRRRTEDGENSSPRQRKRPEVREESPRRQRKRLEDGEEESPPRQRGRPEDREESPQRQQWERSEDREESTSRQRKRSEDREESPPRWRKRPEDREESPARWRSSPADKDSGSHKHQRHHHGEHSHRRKRSSISGDRKSTSESNRNQSNP